MCTHSRHRLPSLLLLIDTPPSPAPLRLLLHLSDCRQRQPWLDRWKRCRILQDNHTRAIQVAESHTSRLKFLAEPYGGQGHILRKENKGFMCKAGISIGLMQGTSPLRQLRFNSDQLARLMQNDYICAPSR